jgi:hypothetical protein
MVSIYSCQFIQYFILINSMGMQLSNIIENLSEHQVHCSGVDSHPITSQTKTARTAGNCPTPAPLYNVSLLNTPTQDYHLPTINLYFVDSLDETTLYSRTPSASDSPAYPLVPSHLDPVLRSARRSNYPDRC